MSYVITEPCVGVCDTACVDVCPVDCIHPKKEEWKKAGYEEGKLEGKQLFIDPVECIDCGACEPVCPVQAIYEESEVPEKWNHYIQKNADYYKKESS